MIDKGIVSCTAQGVKDCQTKLAEVQELLALAKQQIYDPVPYEDAGYTLHRAECKTASAQGILDAISGWLSPVEEGDNL